MCYLCFRLYPDANVTRLGPWAHFNCSFSCSYILDPRDPLFLQIGSLYLTQVVKQFGTDHIYNTDTFNEMTPPSSDTTYLSAVSRSVFASMTSGESLGDYHDTCMPCCKPAHTGLSECLYVRMKVE